MTNLIATICGVLMFASACAPSLGSAVSRTCALNLDWSTESMGDRSDIAITGVWNYATGFSNDDLLAAAQSECPKKFAGYHKYFVGDLQPPPKPQPSDPPSDTSSDTPADPPSETSSEEPDDQQPDEGAAPQTREECGRLGGYVADQEDAGAYTPDEYDSMLDNVDRCYDQLGD